MKLNLRSLAYDLLIRIVHKNAYPDILLNNYFKSNNNLTESERKLITEIVYGVLRWKLKLKYILSLQTKNQLRNKKIELLLMMSLYQIFYLESLPDYAVVNETVNMAKKRFGTKISSFVNAILRQTIKTNDQYREIRIQDNVKSISVNYSFPEWMIEYWSKYMDIKDIIYICKSLNLRPHTTYRVNNLFHSRDVVLEKLSQNNNIKKTNLSTAGLIALGKINSHLNDSYRRGFISIQDEASQLISFILDPKPNDKILDTCSAPGTKSAHIAEITYDKAEIISCDINASRLKLIKNNCKRLGINSVKQICADSTKIENVLNCKFDKILVDAPCSGFGTIKGNPDIKWNKKLDDIYDLADLQYNLLHSASKLLKTGGVLLYSVCTISYLENEDIVDKFIRNHTNFKIAKYVNDSNLKINRLFNRKGYFSNFKKLDYMDGFFAAKFVKTSDE